MRRRRYVERRSGLEDRIEASLQARGVDYVYEELVLEWLPSVKPRRYTPDFVITTRSGKEIVVEVKGYWDLEDRKKMKDVVEQHPDLDIRMVFQRASTKIRRGSPTSYADWCDKHLGIPWAEGDIPDAWLEE